MESNRISTLAHSKWTTHRRIKVALSNQFKTITPLIGQLLRKRQRHSASTTLVLASNKVVNLKRPRGVSRRISCPQLNLSFTRLASWAYRTRTQSILATAEPIVTTDHSHVSSKVVIEKSLASIRVVRERTLMIVSERPRAW